MEGNSPSVSVDSKPLEVNEQKNRVENEESLDTKKNENEQRLSNLLEQPQESKEKQGEQDNTKVNWVIRRTGSSDQRSPSPTSSSTANAAASLQSLQQQQPENSSVHQWKFPSMPPQHAYMPVSTPFPPGHTPMPNYMRTPPSSSPINTLSLPSSPYLSYPPPTSPLSMGLYAAPNGHLGTPYFLSSPPPPPLSASQIPTNSSMLPAGSPLHALLSAVVDRSDVEHLRRMPAGGMESNYMFASPTPMYVPSGHPLYPSPYGYPSSFSAPQRVESPVNPPKIPSPMQYESVTRKDKTRHNKPSSRDAYKEGGEEFLYPEEARGKTSNLSKGTRFRLLEEPDEMQRKSYKKENRCLHPNPLVICKKDAKGDTQKLVDGFVTVKLVDENGMDLPVNKSACLESIDGGLTHPLDEDSSTVFSLKILQTSQGQLFRLLFTVSYRSKGQANVEEKIYSEPFGVYSNKYDRDSRRKRLKTFVYYRAGMPAPGQSSPTHV